LRRNRQRTNRQASWAEAIKRDFGSFENFKKEFNAASVGLFGSGWAWLSVDKDGKLHITKEPNGSNPVRAGLKPLLGFDVWEHAYYPEFVFALSQNSP